MQLSTLTEEGSLQRQLICQLQSIQDHLDRISKHKGVKGVLIAGHDGSIHKSTLDEHLKHEYADMIPSLTALARNMVRELDPQNDLEFLRVRSTKQEIMVAAKNDYVLIVIQEADSSQ